MTNIDVTAVAGLIFAYALISRRLSQRWISGPMAFAVAGLVGGALGLDIIDESFIGPGLELLAEATLVMVLFADATRIDLSRLRGESKIPVRLLAVGLPLTVIFGAVAGWAVFPALGLANAFVLAAALAPTDAALGQAVVSDPSTPQRIRQALNVESGLNDGLTAPLIAIVIGIAAAESGRVSDAFVLIIEQVGFGTAVGVVGGLVGGRLLRYCNSRGWIEGSMLQLGAVSLALLTYAAASVVNGNGFVAAFVAGVAFGAVAGSASTAVTEFAENEGQLLTLLTFLFWSVKVAYPLLGDLTWRVALYVALSLTVVRMVPVALSLIGLNLRAPTVAYLGWFGPRGLASILYGFSAYEALGATDQTSTIELTITWTVLTSIVLHGITALPFASAYGAWFSSTQDRHKLPEAHTAPHIPVRGDATRRPPVPASG